MKIEELIIDFQKKMPDLVKEMKASDHHYDIDNLNPYHLESDVWSHTMMVMLMAREMNSSFIESLACLLHDVGKPMSRLSMDDKKRVGYFGHEGLSCFIALNYLNTLDISDEDKIKVLRLICYHTEIFKLTYNKFNALFKNEDPSFIDSLMKVSKADSLGRFNLDEGRDFPEVKCTKKEDREYQATINVLIGPPCSGKSTWIKENVINETIIYRDDLITEKYPDLSYNEAHNKEKENKGNNSVDSLLHNNLMKAMKNGEDIVVDMTNCPRKSRQKYLNKKGYLRKATVFLNSYDELMRRNSLREDKVLNEYVLVKFMKMFYMPLESEFDEIEYVID